MDFVGSVVFGIVIWFGIVLKIVFLELNFGIVIGSKCSGSLTPDWIHWSFPSCNFGLSVEFGFVE